MQHRHTRKLAYAAGLALVACLALAGAAAVAPPAWGSPWAVIGFSAFTLFALSRAIPTPHIGATSLDRVPLVAAVLVFGPVVAAVVVGMAALCWPFAHQRALRPSLHTLARGLNVFGMFVLMTLAGGFTYQALGGSVPLTELDGAAMLRLLALMVVLQAVNELLFAIWVWLDGRDPVASISMRTVLFEMALVPLGVLTALLYNATSLEVVTLFVALLVIIVFVVQALATTREDLERQVDSLLAINRIGRAISSSLVLDDLTDLIYQECRKLFRFSAFYLVLYDEEHQELDFRLHQNESGRQPRKRKQLGEGAIGWIIENNRPMLIEDWDADDGEFKRVAVIVGEPPKSVIGVPISYRNRVLGAISIQAFVPRAFNPGDLNLMLTFADQVAVALANARLFEELEDYKRGLEEKVEERTKALAMQKEELFQLSESLAGANRQKEALVAELRLKTAELDRQSNEDALTGLYNRRYMDGRLVTELERSSRFERPVAVAMLDVDAFKQTNDHYSHGIADEVLRVMAGILRRQCRGIDVIARYGGDEFVLCFPETDLEGAAMVCEKIRGAVERHEWQQLHPHLRVTVSAGVACAPPDYDAARLVAAADAKLYAAKRAGRNRVCM